MILEKIGKIMWTECRENDYQVSTVATVNLLATEVRSNPRN
jgi:hypothetical protein